MTPKTRGVLWWTLTAILVASILGATAFGGVNLIRRVLPSTNPADSQSARQEELDVG
jgi:hypothetical protein